MSNRHYNGIPETVIRQAFQCKKEVQQIASVNLLNLGSIADMSGCHELRQWILVHPNNEAELFEAMDAYLSGQSPDKK